MQNTHEVLSKIVDEIFKEIDYNTQKNGINQSQFRTGLLTAALVVIKYLEKYNPTTNN